MNGESYTKKIRGKESSQSVEKSINEDLRITVDRLILFGLRDK